LLLVIILVLTSFIHKSKKANIFSLFPFVESINTEDEETPLYLFYFFSKRNCEPCLEVIEVLNRLPNYFKVVGIIPEIELKEENELRNITGANFELRSVKKYKRFLPQYAPTLIGVSKKKRIFFVLPSVPYEKEYLEQFLLEFFRKAYPLILEN